MNKAVVKELIQQELNTKNLVAELALLLNDEKHQQHIKDDYANLKALLKQGGNASAKAAESMYSYLYN